MIAESFSLLPIPLSIPFALSNHHICPLIDLVILNDSNDLFCEFAKFKSLSHATTYTYCNICKACCRYTSIDTYVVCYWRKMLNACAVPCFGRDMTKFCPKTTNTPMLIANISVQYTWGTACLYVFNDWAQKLANMIFNQINESY